VAPALGDDDVPDVVWGRRSLRRVRGSGLEELARAGAGAGWGSGRGHSDEEAGGFLGARLAGGVRCGVGISGGERQDFRGSVAERPSRNWKGSSFFGGRVGVRGKRFL
jgi:hypothetical protein